MVTYKKIAEVAEVSESTVSKALTGSGEIAPITAEKIRKIACELGYYRDKREVKRSYSNNFAPHIAIICPEIVSVFYSSLAERVIDKIADSGGRTTIMITRFGKGEAESIADSIAHNPDFDGIISLQVIGNYSELNMPIVFMCQIRGEGVDMIYRDTTKSIEALVEYLVSTNHKKIGFIGEIHTIYKEELFRKLIEARSLPVIDEYIFRSDKRFFEAGREAYHRMFVESSMPLPDAVICAYDEIAFSFMSEAAKNGVSIPDDISVVGINNIPFCEVSSPPLTTADFQCEKIANKAYDLIISRILGAKIPYQKICYNGSVIRRRSVKERGI